MISNLNFKVKNEEYQIINKSNLKNSIIEQNRHIYSSTKQIVIVITNYSRSSYRSGYDDDILHLKL